MSIECPKPWCYLSSFSSSERLIYPVKQNTAEAIANKYMSEDPRESPNENSARFTPVAMSNTTFNVFLRFFICRPFFNQLDSQRIDYMIAIMEDIVLTQRRHALHLLKFFCRKLGSLIWIRLLLSFWLHLLTRRAEHSCCVF